MPDPTRRSVLIGTAGLAACASESIRGRRGGGGTDDSGTTDSPSTVTGLTGLETADTAMPHTAVGRDRPNVLLVFPDQLRAMALSALLTWCEQ